MDNLTGPKVAESANRIAAWCSVRDLSALTQEETRRVSGEAQLDLMVAFGGGVIQVADTLAEAMRVGLAQRYAIVGGIGHSTEGLRRCMRPLQAKSPAGSALRMLDLESSSEARMMASYLQERYQLSPDWLEERSTNCGNNISFLLDLIDAQGFRPRSVLLCQDAVMQRRMVATLARQVQDRPAFSQMRVLSYSGYEARVVWDDVHGELTYAEPAPRGMWPLSEYLDMLVAEVARLTDDAQGYGPRGRDFIVHLEVPTEVKDAARELQSLCGVAGSFGDSRWSGPLT